VQREEVGTILKVTPQIAEEGTSVVLKISIESSSVLPNSLSTVDITTQKRTITTNVLIDDGGIVVLGGLINHTDQKSDSKIPVLGSIPLLGNLFKTRSGHATKNNLMIFIRPKILRDANQAAFLTDSKYNYMLDQQKRYNSNKGDMDVPILPKHDKPLMPPAPPIPPPSPAKHAPSTPEEKAKAAREQEEFDAEAVRRLEQRQKGQPNSGAAPVAPLPQPPAGTQTPPQGAATHPEGEPPYATEPPGVLMPPSPAGTQASPGGTSPAGTQVPPPPTQPSPPGTPPEGGKQ
jgi:Flp pilus assembly secretin CpaC